MTTPEQLRAKAAQHEQDAIDSFERCDTDGFLSQWASRLSAAKARLQAAIDENGGMHEFLCLTDMDGNLLEAKIVDGNYGRTFIIGEGAWDPAQRVENPSWCSPYLKRNATYHKKGYRLCMGLAPAYADLRGEVNVSAVPIQTGPVVEITETDICDK